MWVRMPLNYPNETASISKDVDMAVRVGFEPTEPAKAQRFSRPPDSTTLAPHRWVAFGLSIELRRELASVPGMGDSSSDPGLAGPSTSSDS